MVEPQETCNLNRKLSPTLVIKEYSYVMFYMVLFLILVFLSLNLMAVQPVCMPRLFLNAVCEYCMYFRHNRFSL